MIISLMLSQVIFAFLGDLILSIEPLIEALTVLNSNDKSQFVIVELFIFNFLTLQNGCVPIILQLINLMSLEYQAKYSPSIIESIIVICLECQKASLVFK